MKQEKIFADGFNFKMKANSPEWVIGSISLKADQAIEFINKHTDKGWVNLNVNIGKSGKPYIELDTWKPEPKKEQVTEASSESLPF
jgi:hypothetical protein